MTDLTIKKNVPFLYLQKLWGCFCSMFGVIIHSHCTGLSDQFCSIWLTLSREWVLYTSEFILRLLSAVTSVINTSRPVPLAAMHALAITLLSPCLTDLLCFLDHELFFTHPPFTLVVYTYTPFCMSYSNSNLCVICPVSLPSYPTGHNIAAPP